MVLEESERRAGVGLRGSDEGNPYRNGGRVSPVQRGMMGHNMLHHGMFGHVLHEIRLLQRAREKQNVYIPLLRLITV